MVQLTIQTVDQWVDDVLCRHAGRLDLSDVEAIDPYALLVLVVTAREYRKRRQGQMLPLDWPRNDRIRTRLNRMGFPQWLGRRSAAEASPVDPASSVAQPITQIDTERSVRRIVETFDRRLALRYPLTEQSRRGLVRIMLELFQNIPQHANATGDAPDVLGLAAMEELSQQQLMLAVADDGVGLRGSLSTRETYSDVTHAQALNEILFKGISRHEDPGRGGELRRIARLIKTWDGTLVIRSGDGVLYMDSEHGDVYETPFLAGVQIAVSLPRYVLGVEPDPGTA